MAPAISLSVLSDALPTNISRKDCLKCVELLDAEDGHNCQSFPKLIMVPFCYFLVYFLRGSNKKLKVPNPTKPLYLLQGYKYI